MSASGYETKTMSFTIDQRLTVDVTLQPEQEDAGTLSGSVTDKQNNSPIPGVTVEAVQNDEVIETATTGTDGTYTMALPEGTYTVTFRAEGYAEQESTVTIKAEEAAEKSVQLEKAFGSLAVTVTVVDEDNTSIPLEGAAVEITSTSGQNTYTGSTDASGVYSIDSLPAGTYELSITADGYAPHTSPLTIKGGEELEKSITLQQGGQCGPEVYWMLSPDGTLRIYGQGEMYDYGTTGNYSPWGASRDKIKAVVVADGVTTVGAYAFYFPTSGSFYLSIASVSLPSTLKSIGDYAFYNCHSGRKDDGTWTTGLTSITIPEGVTSIGNSAFLQCTNLSDVRLPDGLETIGFQAFRECAVTSLTIPDSVTSIGMQAFYRCAALKTVHLPESLTSLSEGIFNGCTALTSIEIPSKVTRIGKQAFYGCNGLTSIVVPDSVTAIGDSAFGDCDNLAAVTLSKNLTTIGSQAFARCYKLSSIEILEGVASLQLNTFLNCTALKRAVLPAGINLYNLDQVFTGSGLTDLYYGGTEEQWKAGINSDNPDFLKGVTIHYNHQYNP